MSRNTDKLVDAITASAHRVTTMAVIKKEQEIIEIAKALPDRIDSIIDSMKYSAPETMYLHMRKLAALSDSLRTTVESLEKINE